MNKQIQTKTQTDDLKELVISFIASNKTIQKVGQEKIEMAVKIAVANGLNPLKKEVYFIPFKDQYGNYDLVIVTGYEVYLKRAETSGKLDWWNVEIVDDTNGKPKKAVITIKRKDWEKEFKHEVYFNEVVQTNKGSWLKMPRFMLRKVAISQGFRLCFPEQIAGLPNTTDEMEGVEQEKENIIPSDDMPATVEQKNILEKLPLSDEIKTKINELTVGEAKKIIYEYTNKRNR